MKRTSGTNRTSVTAAFAACLALGALGTLAGASTAAADSGTSALPADKPSTADLAEAREAATAPATLDTLSRFFARDGAVARSAAAPRAEGSTVPVRTLSPEFVAGKAGAPVARTEFLATKAVASDGQKASVWAAPMAGAWQVVNIATGDDEFRYAQRGERLLPGGTVFREPQIDAWFVSKGAKVLPLDKDAIRAVGAEGSTLDAYRARVRAAYGDKLPGSAYAKKGVAGGYDSSTEPGGEVEAAATVAATPGAGDGGGVTVTSVAAGAGAVLAVSLGGVAAVRRRGRA
ncbi:hypothetical protein [Streptomyces sp. NPDC088789]|uniref:hypothetical protein n=1 Tax=Streptomyces sp. NPDC088789 TaxID=3365899 RepID=UPI003811C234